MIHALLLPAMLVAGPWMEPLSTGGGPVSQPEAEFLAERMLSALGGRAAWARLTNTVNDSQQNRVGEPSVVRAVITMDFERPRFRIDTTGPGGLHLVRVIDEDRHWRLDSEGRIEPVPAELVADDLQWYAAHVYRTLHRVATRDPDITLAIGPEGRLEILERGKPLAWYALDARAEPYAFGAAGKQGSICGPWEFEANGIRHPLWVSSRDGTWRAMVKGLQTNIPLDASLFQRPQAGGASQ